MKCEKGCTCNRHKPKSAETKAKLSAVNKGRKLDPAVIAKISAGKRGVPISASSRAAMSAAWSPEKRTAMSEYRKGKYRNGNAAGFYISTGGYRTLTGQWGHPLADKGGRLRENRKALYTKIGPGPHLCHWGCGRSVDWGGTAGLHADHLNADRLDNRPENLVPSCRPCNSRRRHAGNPVQWHAGMKVERIECNRGHKLSSENVSITDKGSRQCRICRTAQRRRSNDRARLKRIAERAATPPTCRKGLHDVSADGAWLIQSNGNRTCAECRRASNHRRRTRLVTKWEQA